MVGTHYIFSSDIRLYAHILKHRSRKIILGLQVSLHLKCFDLLLILLFSELLIIFQKL